MKVITGDKVDHPARPARSTRLEPQTLRQASAGVKAVEGLGRTGDQPISRSTRRLRLEERRAYVALDAGRTQLKAAFTLKRSNRSGSDCSTPGFRAERRSRRRAVPDEPASCSTNPNDRDIPAQAVAPVLRSRWTTALASSGAFVFKTASGNSEPTQEVVLPLTRIQAGTADGSRSAARQSCRWDIAPLEAPPAGFGHHLPRRARDFDTIKGPNLGKSRELSSRIVTDRGDRH